MNPLAGLYGAATNLRNNLFDRQILKSRRLRLPVVSVGNLSVGGTGKTPFVIALGKLLKNRGVKFDILSRGYGRKSRGVFVVDPLGTSSQFGDEPLLLARELGVPVIVGESRYQAGQIAEKQFPSQLHILDDGFQHRHLARDFDIVLLSQSDFADSLLPLGRLREPLSSLQRADAIVLPESPWRAAQESPEIIRHAEQEKMICHLRRKFSVPDAPDSPIVFCGIARPQPFFGQVRDAGFTPAAEITFRDHHHHSRKDVDQLLALQKKTAANGFITTAKDAINLESLFASQREPLTPLVVASLTIELDRPDDLVDAILCRIAGRMPQS